MNKQLKSERSSLKLGNILKDKKVSLSFNNENKKEKEKYLKNLSLKKSAKIVEEIVCSKLGKQILKINQR